MANVTRHTINTWIGRFNSGGIDALIERPRTGRPKKITPQQTNRYKLLIENPQQADQTHWTGKKFHGYLRATLQHEVGYSTVMNWLHDQGYRFKVPQPWPDRQDEALREAFCERVRGWLQERGVEGDPRPRRRWTMKGVKARVTKNGDHVRMNVTGMICPRTGECYALEFSHSDGVTFQCFLDEANADVKPQRKRNLLIMDNASWHKSSSLEWGQFEPIYLPPYSPDLNPIERLWLLIKGEWFSDFVAKDREALIIRLDRALC
jgi:transposase